MHETQTAAWTAEREELAVRIAGAAGAERRSLIARKAGLTKKINAAATATVTLQVAAPAPAVDDDAPMSQQQIIAEARAMLAEHGLAAQGWTVALSNIMTKTYGLCSYRDRQIRIAARVAALNPASETRNTIAHEVAHAIAGGRTGHGPAWKAACAVTGARPQRCHTAETVPSVDRWIAVCEACGEKAGGRKSAPKAGATYHHRPSQCSTGRKGVIRWERNDG